MKDGLPQVIDIWMEKVRRGWKIEDCPSPSVRKELRKRLEGEPEGQPESNCRGL